MTWHCHLHITTKLTVDLRLYIVWDNVSFVTKTLWTISSCKHDKASHSPSIHFIAASVNLPELISHLQHYSQIFEKENFFDNRIWLLQWKHIPWNKWDLLHWEKETWPLCYLIFAYHYKPHVQNNCSIAGEFLFQVHEKHLTQTILAKKQTLFLSVSYHWHN